MYYTISRKTPVIVTRTTRSFGEGNEHGPMTWDEAAKQGLLSSSSGTVHVSVRRAADSASVSQDAKGTLRAYIPPTFDDEPSLSGGEPDSTF